MATSSNVLAQAPVRAAAGPRAPLPARGEFVIRGAHVLTMDPGLADLPSGDVHVRDGAIVAVGANLNAPGATAIQGNGMICMPGFIDTHWHLWTSLFRPYVRADVDAFGYFPVSNRLGQLMTPEDSYRAVILGTAEALSAGVTTIHNWAHNVRSPEHADGELAAMRDAGIRGRFAYGPAQGMPDDQMMDFAGMARVQRDWMPNDGMLTMGICSRNVGAMSIGGAARGVLSIDMVKKDWGEARKLGLPITLHTSGPSPIRILEAEGLLGPDVQLIHPLLTTLEERDILKARGVSYSMAPVGEARRPSAVGVIQLGEMLESGVKVSLSTDHTTNYNCDPFVAMRLLFAIHQHRIGNKVPLSTRRLVQLATLDGAVDLGIASRTGSLTPGKRADLILVRTTDINMAPVGNPYEALVQLAQPSNVDMVVVDGRILRQAGKFTALDHAKVLSDAREASAALRSRANWPPA
ncbi:MAG: amidohydrolase family protein [Alphaproteobacteria bacterium]|nr:amidohydrolase family protein [Alphaproteobacteria bacterium]